MMSEMRKKRSNCINMDRDAKEAQKSDGAKERKNVTIISFNEDLANFCI